MLASPTNERGLTLFFRVCSGGAVTDVYLLFSLASTSIKPCIKTSCQRIENQQTSLVISVRPFHKSTHSFHVCEQLYRQITS